MDLEEQENKKDLEGDLKEELGVEKEEKNEIAERPWATTPPSVLQTVCLSVHGI